MQERVNLSPLHWGPKTWFFLESAAIAYPVSPTDEQKTSAKNLLLSLKDMLPCETCRINYKNYLDQTISDNYFDDIVKSRDTLLTYIIDIHNDVREKKNQTPRTIEDTFDYYQLAYTKNPDKPENIKKNSSNNKMKTKNEIIKTLSTCNAKEDFTEKTSENFSSEMLYHFNPITLLIGVMLGLIIYKFYFDNVCANEKS
jgi:hypothetical protein